MADEEHEVNDDKVVALLADASDKVARQQFDPQDDLRRGHAARRRRTSIATAAAVLGTAAAVVLAIALAGQTTARPGATDLPAGGGPQPSTEVTVSAPATPSASSASSASAATSAPSVTVSTPPAATATADQGALGLPTGTAAFSRILFSVAQDHLDPGHNRLQWSEGFTGSSGGSLKQWGRKFGWQAPADPGQAVIYLGVGNIPAPDRQGCGQYDYRGTIKCGTALLPNGQPADVLNSPTHREVHWSRPDGTYVFAIVDAVFGNNTTVASTAPLPTLAQLEEYVLDPRLVLPPT